MNSAAAATTVVLKEGIAVDVRSVRVGIGVGEENYYLRITVRERFNCVNRGEWEDCLVLHLAC